MMVALHFISNVLSVASTVALNFVGHVFNLAFKRAHVGIQC